MKTIARILPHLTIVLSGMMLVFYVLDQFNPMMGFLDNAGEHVVLLGLAVTAIVTSILLIGYQRRS